MKETRAWKARRTPLSLFIALAVFLFFPKEVFGANLLTNSGFEDGVTPWSKYGGTLEVVSDYVHSGTEAARLTSTTVSTKWIYQVVSVVRGTAYVFSGYLIKNSPNISSVLLRIAWYKSLDGSGDELSHSDSPSSLTDDNVEYRLLSTGAVVVPDDANSARVKTVIAFNSTAQTSAYLDDFIFEETTIPTPTPTPTDEPDPTNTPTPTPILIPTSTPTPTPTKKPTPTLTPIPTASDSAILGETTEIFSESPTPVPENPEVANIENNKSVSLPVILIGSGVLLIFISLGLLLLPKFNRYKLNKTEN